MPLGCPRVAPLTVAGLTLLALAGCGGGKSSSGGSTPTGTQAVLSPPTGTTLPVATVGVVYSDSFTVVSGGGAPYTATVANAPQGLSLAAIGSSFVLSGTPTTTGTFSPQLHVVDAVSVSTFANYTLTVQSASSQIPISPSSLPNAQVNTAYTQTLTALSGTAPFTWTINNGALPPTYVLGPGPNASTSIGGTTSFGGTYVFTVQVTDSSTPPMHGSTFYSLSVN